MHVEIIQLTLLLMGKTTSATWTQELKDLLGTIRETPALTGGTTPDSSWIKAAEGYLIQPIQQHVADVEMGRQTCKELDRAATLFHSGIDPLGTELITNSFATVSQDFQESNLKFMIDHTGLRGKCTYVKYNQQRLITITESCNKYDQKPTTVICIRRSQPTPRLAGTMGQYLTSTITKRKP